MKREDRINLIKKAQHQQKKWSGRISNATVQELICQLDMIIKEQGDEF
mgnify:FL=1